MSRSGGLIFISRFASAETLTIMLSYGTILVVTILLTGQVFIKDMIKGYIFDMDGTLIDSMGMICKIDESILDKLGVGRDESLLDAMRYIPLGESAQYVKDHCDVKYSAEEILDIMIRTMIEGYKNVPVKDSVTDYLAFCREKGIKMAIATATEPDIARDVAGKLGLLGFMECTVSCTDVGKSKEHPDVFLECARKLGLNPEECSVFEDGIPGAVTSIKAGFTVVGVYDATAGADGELRLKEISDKYIYSFKDIESRLIDEI